MKHGENLDSAISYSVGGLGVAIAHLAEQAQHITLIVAMVIVIIRAVYDGVRLYRYLKSRE